MSRGGARVWGNAHPAAQLTEKKVIRYRAMVRGGKATVGEIAAKEGCSHGRISMAMRGETWAHLNEVAPPVPGRPRTPSAAKAGGKSATKVGRAKAAAKQVVVTKAVAKKAVGKNGVAKKAVAKRGAVGKSAVSKGAVSKGAVSKGAVAKGAGKKVGAKGAAVTKAGRR